MAGEEFSAARIKEVLEAYWERHDYMPAGPEAGNPELFEYEHGSDRAEQTLPDPEDEREWRMRVRVDLSAWAGGHAQLLLRTTRRGRVHIMPLERQGFGTIWEDPKLVKIESRATR